MGTSRIVRDAMFDPIYIVRRKILCAPTPYFNWKQNKCIISRNIFDNHSGPQFRNIGLWLRNSLSHSHRPFIIIRNLLIGLAYKRHRHWIELNLYIVNGIPVITAALSQNRVWNFNGKITFMTLLFFAPRPLSNSKNNFVLCLFFFFWFPLLLSVFQLIHASIRCVRITENGYWHLIILLHYVM